MHQCVICVGSNYNRRMNMTLARNGLKETFSSVCFASERETTPLFLTNPALFSNQVAVFVTDKTESEVRSILKDIERRSGRCPNDKLEERILLDIDLLAYDACVLKPEDWQRDYIQQDLSIINSLV